MKLGDVLFNDALDKSKLYKKSLQGGTLDPVKRYGDLQNAISIGTAGKFLTADLIKESMPYSRELQPYEDLNPYLTPSFADEVLRHLMYDVTPAESNFNMAEASLWEEYKEYQLGVPKTGSTLISVQILDAWLLDEVYQENIGMPIFEYPDTTFTNIFINRHFLYEVRRQMAGDIAEGTSTFSPMEQKFWDNFQLYQGGAIFVGEELTALQSFDEWLMRELMGYPQFTIERDYETDHKWYKLGTRT